MKVLENKFKKFPLISLTPTRWLVAATFIGGSGGDNVRWLRQVAMVENGSGRERSRTRAVCEAAG